MSLPITRELIREDSLLQLINIFQTIYQGVTCWLMIVKNDEFSCSKILEFHFQFL